MNFGNEEYINRLEEENRILKGKVSQLESALRHFRKNLDAAGELDDYSEYIFHESMSDDDGQPSGAAHP